MSRNVGTPAANKEMEFVQRKDAEKVLVSKFKHGELGPEDGNIPALSPRPPTVKQSPATDTSKGRSTTTNKAPRSILKSPKRGQQQPQDDDIDDWDPSDNRPLTREDRVREKEVGQVVAAHEKINASEKATGAMKKSAGMVAALHDHDKPVKELRERLNEKFLSHYEVLQREYGDRSKDLTSERHYANLPAIMAALQDAAEDAEAEGLNGDEETFNRVQGLLSWINIQKAPDMNASTRDPDYIKLLHSKLNRSRETIETQRTKIKELQKTVEIVTQDNTVMSKLNAERADELKRVTDNKMALETQLQTRELKGREDMDKGELRRELVSIERRMDNIVKVNKMLSQENHKLQLRLECRLPQAGDRRQSFHLSRKHVGQFESRIAEADERARKEVEKSKTLPTVQLVLGLMEERSKWMELVEGLELSAMAQQDTDAGAKPKKFYGPPPVVGQASLLAVPSRRQRITSSAASREYAAEPNGPQQRAPQSITDMLMGMASGTPSMLPSADPSRPSSAFALDSHGGHQIVDAASGGTRSANNSFPKKAGGRQLPTPPPQQQVHAKAKDQQFGELKKGARLWTELQTRIVNYVLLSRADTIRHDEGHVKRFRHRVAELQEVVNGLTTEVDWLNNRNAQLTEKVSQLTQENDGLRIRTPPAPTEEAEETTVADEHSKVYPEGEMLLERRLLSATGDGLTGGTTDENASGSTPPSPGAGAIGTAVLRELEAKNILVREKERAILDLEIEAAKFEEEIAKLRRDPDVRIKSLEKELGRAHNDLHSAQRDVLRLERQLSIAEVDMAVARQSSSSNAPRTGMFRAVRVLLRNLRRIRERLAAQKASQLSANRPSIDGVGFLSVHGSEADASASRLEVPTKGKTFEMSMMATSVAVSESLGEEREVLQKIKLLSSGPEDSAAIDELLNDMHANVVSGKPKVGDDALGSDKEWWYKRQLLNRLIRIREQQWWDTRGQEVNDACGARVLEAMKYYFRFEQQKSGVRQPPFLSDAALDVLSMATTNIIHQEGSDDIDSATAEQRDQMKKNLAQAKKEYTALKSLVNSREAAMHRFEEERDNLHEQVEQLRMQLQSVKDRKLTVASAMTVDHVVGDCETAAVIAKNYGFVSEAVVASVFQQGQGVADDDEQVLQLLPAKTVVPVENNGTLRLVTQDTTCQLVARVALDSRPLRTILRDVDADVGDIRLLGQDGVQRMGSPEILQEIKQETVVDVLISHDAAFKLLQGRLENRSNLDVVVLAEIDAQQPRPETMSAISGALTSLGWQYNVDVVDLRNHNSVLPKGTTVKVPVKYNSIAAFQSSPTTRKQSTVQIQPTTQAVQPGDTLTTLARTHGVLEEDIRVGGVDEMGAQSDWAARIRSADAVKTAEQHGDPLYVIHRPKEASQTVGEIATQYDVPVEQIWSRNPHLRDANEEPDSNVVVTSPLRIPVSPSAAHKSIGVSAELFVAVRGLGNTPADVKNKYGITSEDLKPMKAPLDPGRNVEARITSPPPPSRHFVVTVAIQLPSALGEIFHGRSQDTQNELKRCIERDVLEILNAEFPSEGSDESPVVSAAVEHVSDTMEVTVLVVCRDDNSAHKAKDAFEYRRESLPLPTSRSYLEEMLHGEEESEAKDQLHEEVRSGQTTVGHSDVVGLDVPPQEAFHVTAKAASTLSDIALRFGVPSRHLKIVNPSLSTILTGTSGYTTDPVTLRGITQIAVEYNKQLIDHEVAPHDTLETIADRYGMAISRLIDMNVSQLPLPGSTKLRVPKVEEEKDSGPLLVMVPESTATLQAFLTENHLTIDDVEVEGALAVPGSVLRIPGTSVATHNVRREDEPAATKVIGSVNERNHTVEEDETLESIAEACGVSLAAVVRMNVGSVRVGPSTQVRVPVKALRSARDEIPAGFYLRHEVGERDTAQFLSLKYNQGVTSILEANPTLYGLHQILVPIPQGAVDLLLKTAPDNCFGLFEPEDGTADVLSVRFQLDLDDINEVNSSFCHQQLGTLLPMTSQLACAFARQNDVTLYTKVSLRYGESLSMLASRYETRTTCLLHMSDPLLGNGVHFVDIPVSHSYMEDNLSTRHGNAEAGPEIIYKGTEKDAKDAGINTQVSESSGGKTLEYSSEAEIRSLLEYKVEKERQFRELMSRAEEAEQKYKAIEDRSRATRREMEIVETAIRSKQAHGAHDVLGNDKETQTDVTSFTPTSSRPQSAKSAESFDPDSRTRTPVVDPSSSIAALNTLLGSPAILFSNTQHDSNAQPPTPAFGMQKAGKEEMSTSGEKHAGVLAGSRSGQRKSTVASAEKQQSKVSPRKSVSIAHQQPQQQSTEPDAAATEPEQVILSGEELQSLRHHVAHITEQVDAYKKEVDALHKEKKELILHRGVSKPRMRTRGCSTVTWDVLTAGMSVRGESKSQSTQVDTRARPGKSQVEMMLSLASLDEHSTQTTPPPPVANVGCKPRTPPVFKGRAVQVGEEEEPFAQSMDASPLEPEESRKGSPTGQHSSTVTFGSASARRATKVNSKIAAVARQSITNGARLSVYTPTQSMILNASCGTQTFPVQDGSDVDIEQTGTVVDSALIRRLSTECQRLRRAFDVLRVTVDRQARFCLRDLGAALKPLSSGDPEEYEEEMKRLSDQISRRGDRQAIAGLRAVADNMGKHLGQAFMNARLRRCNSAIDLRFIHDDKSEPEDSLSAQSWGKKKVVGLLRQRLLKQQLPRFEKSAKVEKSTVNTSEGHGAFVGSTVRQDELGHLTNVGEAVTTTDGEEEFADIYRNLQMQMIQLMQNEMKREAGGDDVSDTTQQQVDTVKALINRLDNTELTAEQMQKIEEIRQLDQQMRGAQAALKFKSMGMSLRIREALGRLTDDTVALSDEELAMLVKIWRRWLKRWEHRRYQVIIERANNLKHLVEIFFDEGSDNDDDDLENLYRRLPKSRGNRRNRARGHAVDGPLLPMIPPNRRGSVVAAASSSHFQHAMM